MRPIALALATSCVVALALETADGATFDAAQAFGARQSVTDLSLSPDGQNLAWIAPAAGQGAVAYTLSLAKDAKPKPKPALAASGNPERLEGCGWVSNERLVCEVYILAKDPQLGPLPFTRLVAVNADGSNPKVLSNEQTAHTHGLLMAAER